MPKVKRSRKPPPDGWELIEPTLDELDQKMREGKPVDDDYPVVHTTIGSWLRSLPNWWSNISLHFAFATSVYRWTFHYITDLSPCDAGIN